jgi:hypothetical protein
MRGHYATASIFSSANNLNDFMCLWQLFDKLGVVVSYGRCHMLWKLTNSKFVFLLDTAKTGCIETGAGRGSVMSHIRPISERIDNDEPFWQLCSVMSYRQ